MTTHGEEMVSDSSECMRDSNDLTPGFEGERGLGTAKAGSCEEEEERAWAVPTAAETQDMEPRGKPKLDRWSAIAEGGETAQRPWNGGTSGHLTLFGCSAVLRPLCRIIPHGG